MSNFKHACHVERISSGELQRLTGIIEAYRDKHGKIALTDQNERLHDYGDQSITPEQQAAIETGNRKWFWTMRQQVGDPIADVALPILNNEGINGRIANWLTGLKKDPVRLNKLGIRLMEAHRDAVISDIKDCGGNVPGLLSPNQVAKYHHDVFKEFGIGSFLLGSDGSWLFGGTLFNLPANIYRPVWCNACDFIDPD